MGGGGKFGGKVGGGGVVLVDGEGEVDGRGLGFGGWGEGRWVEKGR